jgi:hypothetical protein
MTVFNLPLENTPQIFDIDLSNGEYQIESVYNDYGQFWSISISKNGESLIANLALSSGVDLLSQHGYLGITGQLKTYTDGKGEFPPTETNLGVECNLLYAV